MNNEVRTRYLEMGLYIRVIRFPNGDVFGNLKGVAEKIWSALTTPVPPPAD